MPQGMTMSCMDISYTYPKALFIWEEKVTNICYTPTTLPSHFPTFTHSHPLSLLPTPLHSPPLSLLPTPPLPPPHTPTLIPLSLLPTPSHSNLLQHPDPGGQLFSWGSLGALEGLPLSLQLAHLLLQHRDLWVKVPYHTLIGHTQCLQLAQCSCWKGSDQNFLHR